MKTGFLEGQEGRGPLEGFGGLPQRHHLATCELKQDMRVQSLVFGPGLNLGRFRGWSQNQYLKESFYSLVQIKNFRLIKLESCFNIL